MGEAQEAGIEIIIEPDVVPLGKVDARLFPVYFARLAAEQAAKRQASRPAPAPAPEPAPPVVEEPAPALEKEPALVSALATEDDFLSGQDVELELTPEDEIVFEDTDAALTPVDPAETQRAPRVEPEPTVLAAEARQFGEDTAVVSAEAAWGGSSDEIPELSVSKSLRSGFWQLARITVILLLLGGLGYLALVRLAGYGDGPVAEKPDGPAQPALPDVDPAPAPTPEAPPKGPEFAVAEAKLLWEDEETPATQPPGSAATEALERKPLEAVPAPEPTLADAAALALTEDVSAPEPEAEPEVSRDVIQALLDKARTAEMVGDFDRAIEHYREVLALNPGEPGVHFSIGAAYHELGNLDRARESYLLALEQNPRDPRTLSNLGLIALAGGDLDSAEERFWDALMVDPAFAPALTNLGLVFESRDQLGEAISYYRQALDADPGQFDARFNLAELLASGGGTDEAIRHLETLTSSRRDPYRAWAWKLLGKIRARDGDLEGAIEAFEAALAIDPDFLEVRTDLGVAYLEQGNPKRAREQFDTVLARRPDSAYAWNALGVALVELGRLWTAKDAYLKAIEIDPGFANAHFNYGVLMEDFHEIYEALRAYDRTLRVDSRHFPALINLGVVLRRNAETTDDSARRERLLKESIDYFDRAIAISPLASEATINKGRALLLLGQRDEAQALWQAYIDAAPESVGAEQVRAHLEGEAFDTTSTGAVDPQYNWNK